MDNRTRKTLVVTTLVLSLLGGCASTPRATPSDERDTTGAYDGRWIGSVGAPRARVEQLPGQRRMLCEWEPFEVSLTVENGEARVGREEATTPVSAAGDFRLDIGGGEAEQRLGVMSGNDNAMDVFTGNLSGDEPRGRFLQLTSAVDGNGCNAPIRFRRDA